MTSRPHNFRNIPYWIKKCRCMLRFLGNTVYEIWNGSVGECSDNFLLGLLSANFIEINIIYLKGFSSYLLLFLRFLLSRRVECDSLTESRDSPIDFSPWYINEKGKLLYVILKIVIIIPKICNIVYVQCVFLVTIKFLSIYSAPFFYLYIRIKYLQYYRFVSLL